MAQLSLMMSKSVAELVSYLTVLVWRMKTSASKLGLIYVPEQQLDFFWSINYKQNNLILT
jgi:hypothetical protein